MKLAVKQAGKRALWILAVIVSLVPLMAAQAGGGMMSGGELPANSLPPNLGNVIIDQKLGSQIPLELPFRDETGAPVQLKQYFQPGRPVILNLVYYDCPMLCTEVLNGLTSTLRLLKLDMGREYEVVTVSFDPREKPELAAAKKKAYLMRLGKPEAEQGWHFFTGDQEAITALTNAVGFHYQWDERLQQFAHATAIMVATPEGKLSHYFFGVEYAPKDVRLGLVEASERKIGSPVDAVLLYCYHYDPRTGKYGAIVSNILRLAGIATVVIIGGGLMLLFRLDPNRKKRKLAEQREPAGVGKSGD